MTTKSLANWKSPERKELMRQSGSGRWDIPTGMFVDTWGGWTWDTKDGETYRTSSEGEGLWRWTGNDWKQITGTCQFSLSQDRAKALRELRRAGFKVA